MTKKKSKTPSDISCSFCGKKQEEVSKVVVGPEVYICNECVQVCNEVLVEEGKRAEPAGPMDVPTPRQINETLDEYVVGQDQAKKILSVAVHPAYHSKPHQIRTHTATRSGCGRRR